MTWKKRLEASLLVELIYSQNAWLSYIKINKPNSQHGNIFCFLKYLWAFVNSVYLCLLDHFCGSTQLNSFFSEISDQDYDHRLRIYAYNKKMCFKKILQLYSCLCGNNLCLDFVLYSVPIYGRSTQLHSLEFKHPMYISLLGLL